ncbi:MAG: hypothetical protein J7L55_05135, partial [Desulfurococcales archaeon]|nr:hypothetical protein [Desulfurococcales archaeon]
MKTYVFDIDGVLVESGERLKAAEELARHAGLPLAEALYLEELMNLDRPREVGVRIYRQRAEEGLAAVVSGRPKEMLDLTIKELEALTGLKP